MEYVEGRVYTCGDQTSAGSGKVCSERRMTIRSQPPPPPPARMFKKVQVVYYLSRDGHLEHPHYMEVSHLAHQPLRLKDVMDRLRNLRGNAMPSLYSWSCKRSYKNGYVWNDLAENDAIYPSEGSEYVLKGSELIDGCTDKLHSLQLGNVLQEPKIKSLVLRQQAGPTGEIVSSSQYNDRENDAKELEEEYEMKTSSNVSLSRCSRGVSTDEIQGFKQQKSAVEFSSLDNSSFSSPPSTTSSDTINNNYNVSKRLGDGDGSPVANEPLLSRNSILLSLIACGGSASFRKTAATPPVVAKQLQTRKSNGDCHKGAMKEETETAAIMMIGCMSENPRFGNLQGEEKEYFSGSIVESMGNQNTDVHPKLKKSSSHNEERSNMGGLGREAAKQEEEEEEEEEDHGMIGRCIPRKKTTTTTCASSSSKPSKKW